MDRNKASISSFSSGTAEISLKTLKMRSNLNNKTDELGPTGITETNTITVSNRFQPSLRNDFFWGSPMYLIVISAIKKSVINRSTIWKAFP